MEPAAFLVGWLLTVKACGVAESGGFICKTMILRDAGGQWACEERQKTILDRLPATPPSLWGFPDGEPIEVRATCAAIKGDKAGV